MTYTKTFSAWNSSLRHAKHNSAVNEYPAVKSATTKTDKTAWLSLYFFCMSSVAYKAGRIRYLSTVSLLSFSLTGPRDLPSQYHPRCCHRNSAPVPWYSLRALRLAIGDVDVVSLTGGHLANATRLRRWRGWWPFRDSGAVCLTMTAEVPVECQRSLATNSTIDQAETDERVTVSAL